MELSRLMEAVDSEEMVTLYQGENKITGDAVSIKAMAGKGLMNCVVDSIAIRNGMLLIWLKVQE